jgi:CRISPR-associated endonuclease/helicase Cas3
MDFATFFNRASGGRWPYPYQASLAESEWRETLVVPTGFGKTAAILGAWLWKMARADSSTPRRLVYCLPMRTLVEQTEAIARVWIEATKRELGLDVQLAILLGGRDAGTRNVPDWIMQMEKPTIIVGTQDLLVSAALMRGYGAKRYRWPVDFALLHNGALWVFDEVQLAGASLTTSAQLEAFRRAFGVGQRSRTLWMSATIDREWLRTVDFTPKDAARRHAIDLSDADIDKAPHLWTAHKRLARLDLPSVDLNKKDGLKFYAGAIADYAVQRLVPNANVIIFLNTVPRAQAVLDALATRVKDVDHLLIHSRFRTGDRAKLTGRLLGPLPPSGRIVIATQALEAGVDVSSALMITEIAPWSSMVQRFGRCNRYGELGEAGADMWWVDLPAESAAPYRPAELADARTKLASLAVCDPVHLATIPPSWPESGHVVRRRDLLDLFDTDPDLSGFDTDVSIYVRDADDTDVRVFWRPLPEGRSAPPEDASEPQREELCAAPIGRAKELVRRASGRAWRWDALERRWRTINEDGVFPGLELWIDAAIGGYDELRGFDPLSKSVVDQVEQLGGIAPEALGDNRESLTADVRISLLRHTDHVQAEVTSLVDALGVQGDDRDLLLEVAVWHDWGKAHEAFVALTRSALVNGVEPPLAKWPRPPKGTPRPKEARRFFRHELASALGFLARHDWADIANLSAYLIASHHGKVRMRLRALPEETRPDDDRLFARGVYDGDILPATKLGGIEIPETKINLDIMLLGDSERCGPSWSARTQRLLRENGPFKLAWLEALVRIADWRASAAEERAGHDDL